MAQRSPSSVLLIKLRHHGDVLLATPVARVLKAQFPNCQIDFLVYEGTEALLEHNPDLRQVWIWHRAARGWNRLKKILHLFFQLQHQHYDLVIHLSDQMQGALLAALLRPHQSIGIDYPKRRHFFWSSCFTTLVPLFPSNTHHTVEQNLATLAAVFHASHDTIGESTHSSRRASSSTPHQPPQLPRHDQYELSGPEIIFNKRFVPESPNHMTDPMLRCRLVISQKDRLFIQEQLQKASFSTPYLLIHPTARWFFKCWEEESFAKLITHFANQGWSILLTSGPAVEEQAMVATILEKVHSDRIYSLAGQLTLGQLAAAIEGATLFIGVDSVPMHMAAALEKDVVALFGPSKINEWHPWMTRYHLVKASDYGDLIDPDDVRTETVVRYLSMIPVEEVISKVEQMLHLSYS
ncbi:MAG: putative lipopolysaccharide heptosyltransferase III [Verrucomicrobiae bacterium]|jgi:heptosyltransferase-3|nr:putative lipopolysaccharide heptosyltransferase III [Verrucomicrobiae bacterium]